MPRGVAQAYAAVPLEQRSGLIGVVPVGAIERGLNPSEAEIARLLRAAIATISRSPSGG